MSFVVGRRNGESAIGSETSRCPLGLVPWEATSSPSRHRRHVAHQSTSVARDISRALRSKCDGITTLWMKVHSLQSRKLLPEGKPHYSLLYEELSRWRTQVPMQSRVAPCGRSRGPPFRGSSTRRSRNVPETWPPSQAHAAQSQGDQKLDSSSEVDEPRAFRPEISSRWEEP